MMFRHPFALAAVAALCSCIGSAATAEEARTTDGRAAEEHLRSLIIKSVREGAALRLYHEFMGRRMRADVEDAAESGLTALIAGQPMNIAWNDLSPASFIRLAGHCIDNASAKDHLALARFCLANDMKDEGEKELARAFELDPSLSYVPEPAAPAQQAGSAPLPPETGPIVTTEIQTMSMPDDLPPPKGVIRVQMFLKESGGIARTAWPVTCGVPFADGELPASVILRRSFRVTDASGNEVPSQAEVACVWGRYPRGPNGYAKWVHVTFLASVGAKGRGAFNFEAGPGVGNNTQNVVKIEQAGRGVVVTTGPMKFSVGANGMNLLDAVWLDTNGDGSLGEGEQIVEPRAEGNMYVEHQNGKGATLSDAGFKLEVEEAGPLRAVIKATSNYDNEFVSVVRIYAYAGKTHLRVQDTLVHGPLGQGLHAYNRTGRSRLAEHSLFVPLRLGDGAKATFGGGQAVPLGEAWLEQDVKHNFKPGGGGFLYELKTPGGTLRKGDKAPGWVDVSDNRWGMTACVRYFWQLFPKRLRTSKEGLKLELWARDAHFTPDGADTHYQGMARTHDVLLVFHSGGFSSTCEALAASHIHELFATCTPERYCRSRAYARHPLMPGKDPRVDNLVYRIAGTNGNSGFPAWRVQGDEWGYFNFGDSMLGPYWACLEYDSPWGLLQNFYRLGDVEILREVAILSRCSYDMLFRHHFTEATSMYPQCSHDKNERHFSGGDSHGHTTGTDPGHIFIAGLVNYWYLTGDRRARDVIFWSFPVYYGDDKERVSCGGTWRYCGGYLMDILTRAYELTWEKRYIDRMEWMCERVFRSTPSRHADGVWWDGSDGRFSCQPWLGDSVVNGYTSYLDINPTTQYRKDIEDAVVKIADFIDHHAYARDRKAIHQGITKTSKDRPEYKPTGSYYGGFMCMMSSFTLCKAYELTGNKHCFDVAQQLFNDGLTGWDANGAKSAGEAMLYCAQTLYYLKGGQPDLPTENR